MTCLELDNVEYTYSGNSEPLLAGISCTLSAQEFVVLTGSNGSGKSTLARLIAGLIYPDAGEIRGRRDASNGWNGVALVMQDPSAQMLTASVESEIAWGLENLAIDHNEIARRVEAVLRDFGLTDLRKKPPELLADGESQLVAFAANMVMEPDILILDEATAYLDLKWRRHIWEAAQEASKRCGVIWITTREPNHSDLGSIWRLEGGKLSISSERPRPLFA